MLTKVESLRARLNSLEQGRKFKAGGQEWEVKVPAGGGHDAQFICEALAGEGADAWQKTALELARHLNARGVRTQQLPHPKGTRTGKPRGKAATAHLSPLERVKLPLLREHAKAHAKLKKITEQIDELTIQIAELTAALDRVDPNWRNPEVLPE